MQTVSTTKMGDDSHLPQIVPSITFSPNKKVNISLIQQGNWSKSDISFMEFMPPKLEEYTMFTLKQYFFIFWGISILQSVTVMIVKYFTSEQFKKLEWFQKVFHVMECINFAFPNHDWDHEGTGDSFLIKRF